MDIGKISQTSLGNLYFGGWQLVEEKIVTGSPITSYTFSGLNGDVDEEYRVISFINWAADSILKIRLNNDSTSANYGYQNILGSNTTVSATRDTADAIFISANTETSGNKHFSEVLLNAKSGFVRTSLVKTLEDINGTTVSQIRMAGHSWNNTVDNISSIVVLGNTNSIGVGSHILLFKKSLTGLIATLGMKTGKLNVKGNINCGVMQKIYENTLVAAAQSVNITGLDGDIDTIYELKVRAVNGYNGIANYLVRPNNVSTAGNYGHQILYGNNTTGVAARYTSTGLAELAACAVLNELCQIDYILYAKSGYVRTGICKLNRGVATTTVTIVGLMGESWNNTADNITSLVILSDQVNGLGIGTHIELWALRKKI